MRYNLAILRELPVFRAIPYVLELDGRRIETEAMLVAVGNGPSYGGGMRVTPDAAFDDGLLDVLVLHQHLDAGVPPGLPDRLQGHPHEPPRGEVLRARSVRLEAARHRVVRRRRALRAAAADAWRPCPARSPCWPER